MTDVARSMEVPAERGLGTAEFLDRLAEKMRSESGTSLPHAYYLDQVKQQLSAIAPDVADERHAKEERLQSAACFYAWADPHDEKQAGGSGI